MEQIKLEAVKYFPLFWDKFYKSCGKKRVMKMFLRKAKPLFEIAFIDAYVNGFKEGYQTCVRDTIVDSDGCDLNGF